VTKYLKAIIPGVLTVLYGVQAALEDGNISGEEWRNLGILAATTVLVWFVPNKPDAPA